VWKKLINWLIERLLQFLEGEPSKNYVYTSYSKQYNKEINFNNDIEVSND